MSNVYASFSRLFVRNRQLSLILIVSTVVFGMLAFVVTPKQYNPEISLPAYRIITNVPGATAEEVETLVTAEIERKLAEIPGIDTVFSQSLPERSVVTVLFLIGSDTEKSTTQVYEKMYANMNLAPMGVGTPLIRRIDPENVPILTLAITSDVFPKEGLRAFAFDLRKELGTVQGVSTADIAGGRTRELGIAMDPERMATRSVTVEDITRAIQSQNLRMSVGTLESDTLFVPLEVVGTFTRASDLERLIVGGTKTGPVRLQDVATVRDGYPAEESFIRFTTKENDADAVYLSIGKRMGENAVTVSDAVRTKLEELKQSTVPSGIRIDVVRDEGKTASREINGLVSNLISSVIIVAVLLLLFLQWRAAAVVSFAIPLTLFIVLGAGYIWGQSINRITLFALILSLGMLVDNAIVVVENIYRHLGSGKGREEETVHAVSEVGMGLMLSTLTSVIVFLPMKAVTGMMGAYMGPIAFFVPVALLASLFVAYTFSPFLASVILKKETNRTGRLQTIMTTIDVGYRNFIRKILDDASLQRRIMLWTTIVTAVTFLFPLVGIIQFRMLPKADREQFYVSIDAPTQSSLKNTDAIVRKLSATLMQEPNVVSLQEYVGAPPVVDFNGLFRGSDMRSLPSQATVKVNLLPSDQRRESSEQIVIRLRPVLQETIRGDPDVRITLVEDPPGPPVLATLLARVKGPDIAFQEDMARDMLAMFRGTKGVVDVHSTLSTGAPKKVLRIDQEKLDAAGLTASQVAETLSAVIEGKNVSRAGLGEAERTFIRLRVPVSARDDEQDLSRILLRSKTGEMVPLTSIVLTEDASADHPIWHDDGARTTMVFGELAKRPVIYAVVDLLPSLLSYRLPSGKGHVSAVSPFGITYTDTESHATYRIEWGGEFQMTLENFRDLGLAMFLAFFLIYILLVGQFRSFKTPLLIMISILFGVGGVLGGFGILSLFGIYFSATSMIGIIALGGIVVNNAIILLEFIQEKEALGYTPKMAVIEAAQTRLRPILLTSLTTVLGSLTIVSDPVWSGLAWSIVFGLTISTALTLVLFPILYVWSMTPGEDAVWEMLWRQWTRRKESRE